MIHWYYKHRIGYVYGYEDGRPFVCNIFGGNCLCVFTQFFKDETTGKSMERFATFLMDEQHVKNCVKDNCNICPYINAKSVKLNLYYKEARILAKYFAMQGKVKVICYYKEPKKEKE